MIEQRALHTLREHYSAQRNRSIKKINREEAMLLVDLMSQLWKLKQLKLFWILEKVFSMNKFLLEFDHMHLSVRLL